MTSAIPIQLYHTWVLLTYRAMGAQKLAYPQLLEQIALAFAEWTTGVALSS